MEEKTMKLLINRLRHKDVKLREKGLETLWDHMRKERLGDEEIKILLPIVLGLLKDKKPVIRALVAKNLDFFDSAEVVDTLIEALRDDDERVVDSAAETLSYMESSHVVKPLVRALKDEDPCVRWGAARALGERGDNALENVFISALKDKDPNVRREAAWALAELPELHIKAAGPLIKALDDTSSEVRNWAATALEFLPDTRAVVPLIKLLNDESEFVRESAEEALTKIKKSRRLTWKKARLPVSRLIDLATQGNEKARLWATWALGKITSPQRTRALAERLHDDSLEVRKMAASIIVLEKILVPEDLTPLVAELVSDEDQIKAYIKLQEENSAREADSNCKLRKSLPELMLSSSIVQRHNRLKRYVGVGFGSPKRFKRKKLLKTIKPKWYPAPDDESRQPKDEENVYPVKHHSHFEFRYNNNLVHIDWSSTRSSGPGSYIKEYVVFVNKKFSGHGWRGGCSLGGGTSRDTVAMVDRDVILEIDNGTIKLYKGFM